jgi:hypothetical protein
MRFLNMYLLEFDFPSSKFLRNYKEELLGDFLNNTNANGARDMALIESPICDYFEDKIKHIIEDNFHLNHTKYPVQFNLYAQNHENFGSNFHTHSHSPSSICGVFYLDIPQEGGEFEIFHYPYISIDKPFRFKPQEDKLYLFPPWLHHRPLPQKDKEYRICINFNYVGDSRPMLKSLGNIW